MTPFQPGEEQAVIDLIVPIQRDEFGIAISAADQPDLLAIPTFYQSGQGDFWVAKVADRIVGTISLKDIGQGQGALRKMFVAAPYRGQPHRIAARLLDHLLAQARDRGFREIFLGTTDKFHAAHRFYEKQGFREVTAEALPANFPRMAVDTRFYVRALA
ncbi:GNAT family N-acetyltransferase [Methylovirgula sp. 4M-Z18]|uniref:GNAT family N-acetyltransferase n=1 Tax=Methylovirgula sp. 4M-Z18 TaxID=2293567 RepID=UPI0018F36A97|nr:GNAT family N-acetyltransferase [Methylovirgula sp. 4M-Z18]